MKSCAVTYQWLVDGKAISYVPELCLQLAATALSAAHPPDMNLLLTRPARRSAPRKWQVSSDDDQGIDWGLADVIHLLSALSIVANKGWMCARIAVFLACSCASSRA